MYVTLCTKNGPSWAVFDSTVENYWRVINMNRDELDVFPDSSAEETMNWYVLLARSPLRFSMWLVTNWAFATNEVLALMTKGESPNQILLVALSFVFQFTLAEPEVILDTVTLEITGAVISGVGEGVGVGDGLKHGPSLSP